MLRCPSGVQEHLRHCLEAPSIDRYSLRSPEHRYLVTCTLRSEGCIYFCYQALCSQETQSDASRVIWIPAFTLCTAAPNVLWILLTNESSPKQHAL